MEAKISVVGLTIRLRPDHQPDWATERAPEAVRSKRLPFIGPILISLMYLLTAQLVWRMLPLLQSTAAKRRFGAESLQL
jgi:hypothetical protein